MRSNNKSNITILPDSKWKEIKKYIKNKWI